MGKHEERHSRRCNTPTPLRSFRGWIGDLLLCVIKVNDRIIQATPTAREVMGKVSNARSNGLSSELGALSPIEKGL